MPEYRVFLRGADGRLERGARFQASSDEEAIAALKARRLTRTAELWCGGRPVGVFQPADGATGCSPR